MISGILGFVTRTACIKRPGDIDVSSFWSAFFKCSSMSAKIKEKIRTIYLNRFLKNQLQKRSM